MTSELNELNREVGELKATVAQLHRELADLAKEVKELVAILNQGKGAKYVFLIGYTLFGMLGALLAYFGIKLSVGS
jgi:hypothetical protein